MNIRPATESDLPYINDVYNEAVVNSVSTFDLEPRSLEKCKLWFSSHTSKYPVIVLEIENDFIGWASLSPFKERPGYIKTVEDSVYLFQKHTGKGYGQVLLEQLLKIAKENCFHTVIATISIDVQASVKIHEKLGFERIGVMREVGYKFGRWIDVLTMQYFVK